MLEKTNLQFVNLDAYEALESFVNEDKTENKLIKMNLALRHHNVKVEFLRYFIV